MNQWLEIILPMTDERIIRRGRARVGCDWYDAKDSAVNLSEDYRLNSLRLWSPESFFFNFFPLFPFFFLWLFPLFFHFPFSSFSLFPVSYFLCKVRQNHPAPFGRVRCTAGETRYSTITRRFMIRLSSDDYGMTGIKRSGCAVLYAWRWKRVWFRYRVLDWSATTLFCL